MQKSLRQSARHLPFRSLLSRKRGFTLVELLIAIAIISILSAVVLASFLAASKDSRRHACLSNQRQLSSAMLMYAQDYDERFPDYHSVEAYRDSNPAVVHQLFCQGIRPSEQSFIYLLKPFLKNCQIARCPGDFDWREGGREMVSYEYKLWLAEGKSISAIPDASGMALLWEQWGYHSGDGHGSEYSRSTEMNISFADAHAKWRRLGDSASAKYGFGPDLHIFFNPKSKSNATLGSDF